MSALYAIIYCNLFTHKALRSSWELFWMCPGVPDGTGIWKKPSHQGREPTTNSTHKWCRRQDLNRSRWWEASALTMAPPKEQGWCSKKDNSFLSCKSLTKMVCWWRYVSSGILCPYYIKGLIYLFLLGLFYFSFPACIRSCQTVDWRMSWLFHQTPESTPLQRWVVFLDINNRQWRC